MKSIKEVLTAYPSFRSTTEGVVVEGPYRIEDGTITKRQRQLLAELIFKNISDHEERERWLAQIEGASKFDASEMISSFIEGAW